MKKHSTIAKQAKAEGESTATEAKEHKMAARHHMTKHHMTKKPAATTNTSGTDTNTTGK